MIEVEIRGPVAKKEYDRLRKLLETAGANVHPDHQASIVYADRGFANRELRLEYKNGSSKIYVHTGRVGERKEIVVELAMGAFSDAVEMLAELGYKKGTVTAEEVFMADYGGATFSLFDPDGDALHYEAMIAATNPTDAREAKQKLEKLARNFKLPLWGALEMLEFARKLKNTTSYLYDYDTDGPEHFREKFGI